MTQTIPSGADDAPTALTAFLRGIERRGAVFAELHSGEVVAGEQAFAVALRVFRDNALEQPFAHWPRLFWRALLATPQLRTGAPSPRWPEPFGVLGTIGSGPRAALLLRLVAGLADADAAAVLGVAKPTYLRALKRALPHRDDGTPDPDAWRALDEAIQASLRNLPAERLAHLARLRQAAAQGRRPDLIGPLPPPRELDEPSQRSPWPHRLLWTGVAMCALALVGTFIWPLGLHDAGGDPHIRVRALPAARAPAQRYDRATALLTERDFELLAEAEPVPPRDDPAFYAWLAALDASQASQDPALRMREPLEGTAAPQAPADVQALPESAEPESADAPL